MNHSPFEVLVEDHNKIALLIGRIKEEGPRDYNLREMLMEELWMVLDQHSQLEQQTLYPIVEEKESLRDLALEFETEHEWMMQQMELLDSLEFNDARWTDEFEKLVENFDLHVAEEQGELFDKIRAVFSPAEIAEMQRALTNARQDQAA